MDNPNGQYATARNLNTRISIHDKYSVNKTGFGNWIASHYPIAPGDRILELGCGTGSMWKEQLALVQGARLHLTDLSEGMVKAARENLPGQENLTFGVADIQSLPYPDSSFDLVIANMMLYHVPDLELGLSQVRRVLKKGGRFCCATYGVHGIVEFVAELLREEHVQGCVGTRFTLQNGREILSRHFSRVERLDYPDALAVTDVTDFAEYVYSLSGLSGIASVERERLLRALEAKMADGVLHVPKEYGMFICE